MFASNHHQVFRQLGNNNNENVPSVQHGDLKNSVASHSVAPTTSKTPATSNKQRRALGDISNRKNSGLNGSAAAPKKSLGLRLQQQPQQQQRNPFATKTPGLSKRKEVSFLPRPSQTKPTPSLNILPDFGNNNKTPKSRQLSKSATKGATKILAISDIVDEIEKPAGRLWADEPDDSSYGSVSLPGASTFRKDFLANCRQGHALRLQAKKEKEEQDELAFQKFMEDSFTNDEEDIIGANVWIERTQSFYDDLDAELSFDAPSYCADISF